MIEDYEFLKSFGCKIDECKPNINNSEFYSILKKDWLKGVDVSLLNLSNNVGVYQVISCIDVSVPKYKIENVDNDEDNKEEGDYDYKGFKNKKLSRMLKVVLFDGKSKHLLFEYEQISIFDVFYNNSTSSMSRCCAKIALYNSPVYRRNAFWVTNSNVKLLFEGYSCKLHRHKDEVVSEEIPDQILLGNDNSNFSNKNTKINYQNTRVKTFDNSTNTFNNNLKTADNDFYDNNLYSNKISVGSDYLDESNASYSATDSQLEVSQDIIDLANKFLDNVPLKLSGSSQIEDNSGISNTYNKDNKEENSLRIVNTSIFNCDGYMNREVDLSDAPDFDEYFAPQSDYIDHSYVCFLKKLELPYNNETFIKFSNERFLDKLVDMEVNMTNLCNILNFSCNTETKKTSYFGDYNEYKFGFLNHSSVVLYDNNYPLSQLFSLIIEKVFVSFDKKVWFAIFDDCMCPTFCIFTLDIFPHLSQTSDELSISLVLNSLEGFFLFEDFLIEGNKIKVLKSYLQILPYKDVKERIKIVNDEYIKVKQHIMF